MITDVVGNGAQLERYSWTQTLRDVSILAPVRAGLRGRDINCTITATHISFGVRGEPPIVDATLHKPVVADDCMWTLGACGEPVVYAGLAGRARVRPAAAPFPFPPHPAPPRPAAYAEDGPDSSSRLLSITLAKQNTMEWWVAIAEGEPTIDSEKLEPENSKLGDLDPDTRKTVEEMMFNTRQKAMGKPTSDEIKRQAALQRFMREHPEMDFSQARFQ